MTDYSTDQIAIVDLSTNATTGYVNNGDFTLDNPLGVVFSNDGTLAYVLCDVANSVFVVDTSTSTVVNQLCGCAFPFNAPGYISITPDGSKSLCVQ